MSLFKNNRDVDSTIMVFTYSASLLTHQFLTAFVSGYKSERIEELLGNMGIAIIGFLFGKTRNGDNGEKKT